jgi:thiol:disulfide interchange protein DsbA
MSNKLILLLASLMLASACSAHPDADTTAAVPAWVEGTNYWDITPAVPTQSGDQVEVVEVFSYACPHCAHFQPYADRLKASLPKGVVYLYKPAVFYPQWEPYARAYLTAKSMGVAEQAHQALFDALHRDRKPIYSLQDLANFYAAYGVKPDEFLSTAQSFVIDSQLANDVSWERSAGVNGTPTIVVDGKYRTEVQAAGGFEQLIKLVDWLVAREQAARRHH